MADSPLSELHKENQSPPPFAVRWRAAISRHRIVGGLGAIALVMNVRHEVRTISEPFASCRSMADILARLFSMEDATFLGVLTASVILVAPILLIGWAIIRDVRVQKP
jgi:hypothetical protein